MREHLRAELGSLLPAWSVCLLLPLPALLLWHSSDGRNLALGCFFVGCASLVAYSFRRELAGPETDSTSAGPPLPRPGWGVKMAALAVALLALWSLLDRHWETTGYKTQIVTFVLLEALVFGRIFLRVALLGGQVALARRLGGGSLEAS